MLMGSLIGCRDSLQGASGIAETQCQKTCGFHCNWCKDMHVSIASGNTISRPVLCSPQSQAYMHGPCVYIIYI